MYIILIFIIINSSSSSSCRKVVNTTTPLSWVDETIQEPTFANWMWLKVWGQLGKTHLTNNSVLKVSVIHAEWEQTENKTPYRMMRCHILTQTARLYQSQKAIKCLKGRPAWRHQLTSSGHKGRDPCRPSAIQTNNGFHLPIICDRQLVATSNWEK